MFVSMSHVSISISPSPCLRVSGILQMEYETNSKRKLQCVSCKQKTGTANFRLFAANGNGKPKFVYLAGKR